VSRSADATVPVHTASWFDSPRAHFYRACAIGGAAATAEFAWFLLKGRADLLARGFYSNFYDAQAHSLLHGHWDIPAHELFFERFNIGGKFYMYHGPWPALLRLPIAAVTDRYDGRLSAVSMLLGFTVMLVFVARIAWQARVLVRGSGPPARAALVAAGGFVFLVGCGSPALFLSSETWVYHEAILWGVAWALASYSFLISYLTEHRTTWIILAGVSAALALLSRGSVGVGPVLAVAGVLVVVAATRLHDATRRRRGLADAGGHAPWWRRALGLDRSNGNWSLGALAVAAAVPLALYAYVNYSKFGTLFGTPPVAKQDLIARTASRQAALAANGGSLFGVKYAPTTLLQYFRPDAIGFDRLFPWVSYSSARARVIGHVVFDNIGPTASIPAVSTLIVVLAGLGAVTVLRPARTGRETASAAVLRVPLAAAVVAGVGTATIGFLAQRYEADFLPPFVLAGAVGVWSLARALERGARWRRWVLTVGVVALAGWSVWANAAMTLWEARAYNEFVSMGTRASLIDFQLAVHERIPGGVPSRVDHRPALPLPHPGRPNSLLVVGDCAGLYWSNGHSWYAVEETPVSGRLDLTVRFPAAPAAREPLVTTTAGRGSSTLWIRRVAPDRVRLEYEATGRIPTPVNQTVAPDVAVIGPPVSAPISAAPGVPVRLTVRLDPAGYVGVRHRGRVVLSNFAPVADARPVVSTAPAFSGTVTLRRAPTPICHRLGRGRASMRGTT
jgi:hypothetical protein